MHTEIERKFLVARDGWRPEVSQERAIRQGYVSSNVRVRAVAGEAWLTIKVGASPLDRKEFEYAIPHSDAVMLLNIACGDRIIEKTRYIVRGQDGLSWEIDEFSRPYPLVLAEIELSSADQPFVKPAWLGREVTEDPSYTNAVIAAAAGGKSTG